MEQLNDDCLLEILKCLELKDQIALQQVSRRFRFLVHYEWQIKFSTLRLKFQEINISDGEFKILISHICETTEKVNLILLPSEKFEVLKDFRFPKALDFRFSQLSPAYMTDEDMITISDMFPNLRILSPQGRFTGQYMTRLTQLNHLTLTYCRNFKFLHLAKILEELPLKSLRLDIFQSPEDGVNDALTNFCKLESLVVSSYELGWLLSNELNHFNNIKEFTITDIVDLLNITNFYTEVMKYKSNDVVALENTNTVILPAAKSCNAYVNLRKLVFAINENAIEAIPQYLHAIPSLREIHFYACRVSHEEQIQKLFEYGRHLELINIEKCAIEFRSITLNVEDIMEHRTRLLTLNFFQNWYNDKSGLVAEETFAELKLEGYNHLFKVTNQKLSFSSYEGLKFTFQ